MGIDFNKIVESKDVIVPVINGQFQYNRKKYVCDIDLSGWLKVQLDGNTFVSTGNAYPEIDLPDVQTIKGYTYNNNVIFQNFDVGKRKVGVDIMSTLLFNNAPTFSSIKAVLWEDGCLYYYGINYNDFFLSEVKNVFDENRGIKNLHKITPEIKSLYLFHELERQAIYEAKKVDREAEELKKWNESLPGRLHTAFNAVHAKVLEYSVSGNRVIVDWELEEVGRKYNSVLDVNTLVTIEAGYCMSGDDRRHNVSTMVLTAKEFEKNRLSYVITRHTKDDEGHYD